jgi:hypothetical protein
MLLTFWAIKTFNNKKNLFIKTIKMLLHVSILRSSSGSVICSLLKLYIKMLITLLYLSVMLQHILCMCICCIRCTEVGQPTSLQRIQHIHIHTICCRITVKYNKVINILTYNFSKEKCTLSEDDLRIETCSNIFSVLVKIF